MAASLTISRRGVIRMMGAGAALTVSGFPQGALANKAADSRFVVVMLRGAMDGLGAVPPYGDRRYAERRAGLVLPDPGESNGIIKLDGMFGLHPALAQWLPLWQARELLIVHATGGTYRTRSHFDAQDLMETGLTERGGQAGGWMNRMLSLMPTQPPQDNVGLALGSVTPLIMRGDIQVARWENQVIPPASRNPFTTVERLYRHDKQLNEALSEGIKARNFSDRVLSDAAAERQVLQGKFGFEVLAHAAGCLMAGEYGPRVAAIDLGGWDTHVDQGTVSGRLRTALTALQDGLLTLKTALGPAWQKTVIVCLTEFGRTVAPNGTGGTDHGTGSASFVLGGAVAGGRIAGDWVGLDRLEDGRDLRVATHTQAIMKGILRDHLGLPEDRLSTLVFPGSGAIPALAKIVRA